jgi:hypothetical protein
VLDHQVDWFILREGVFVSWPVGDADLYRSEIFPGLWLDPTALLRGDTLTVQTTLQRGLASQEHTDFVAQLKTQAKA